MLLRFVGLLPKVNGTATLMSEHCRPPIGNTPLQKTGRAAPSIP